MKFSFLRWLAGFVLLFVSSEASHGIPAYSSAWWLTVLFGALLLAYLSSEKKAQP